VERALKLFRRRVSQNSNRRFSTGRAESFVAMKSFVGVTMAFSQSFYLLHLAVIFSSAGKELQPPGFQQIIRLGRPGEKLPSSRA
jgi:hypothetical protein